MKRCPACKRVETDDALVFCRADGTPLVSDSGSVSADAGTVKFGAAQVVKRNRNQHPAADALMQTMNRSTGPTTVLQHSEFRTTRELAKPKPKKTAIVIAIIVTAVVAATSAIAVLLTSTSHERTTPPSNQLPCCPSRTRAATPMSNTCQTASPNRLSTACRSFRIFRLRRAAQCSTTKAKTRRRNRSDRNCPCKQF